MPSQAPTSATCIHGRALVRVMQDLMALGLPPPPARAPGPLTSPECVCGECDSPARMYRCQGCERDVPWCVGAHDELLELCDDCAVRVWQVRVDSSAEQGEFRVPRERGKHD